LYGSKKIYTAGEPTIIFGDEDKVKIARKPARLSAAINTDEVIANRALWCVGSAYEIFNDWIGYVF